MFDYWLLIFLFKLRLREINLRLPEPADLSLPRGLLGSVCEDMCSMEEALRRLPWLPRPSVVPCDTVLTSDSSRSSSRLSGMSWLGAGLTGSMGCSCCWGSCWSGTLSSCSGGFSTSLRRDREPLRMSLRIDGNRSLKLLCRSVMDMMKNVNLKIFMVYWLQQAR